MDIHLLQSLPTFAVDVFRLTVWLALLSAIFVPLERLFALHPAKVFRRELLTDLGYYFLNNLVPALLLALPLSVLALIGQKLLPAAVPAALQSLPLAARMALGLIVGEIGFYWGHRLSHKIPWLWRFHAIHHSAAQMDFLVNTRAHPVDILVTRLSGMAPMYLLGLAGPSAAGSVTPVSVILIGTVWGFFIHANLRWRLGPLEWIVSSPAFHHWHHTRIDHTDRNFASMLPVLDRLFGSHYLPRHWPAEVGIAAPMPSTLGGQLIEPLRARPAPSPVQAQAELR